MLAELVLLIIAGAFGVLGAIFWMVGFAVGRGRRRGWIQTMGVWTRFQGALSSSWQVEYTAEGGKTYQVMPWMNATSFAPSGPIPVSYDPQQPERAVIDTFYHRGGALKIMGAVAGSVALALTLVGVIVLL